MDILHSKIAGTGTPFLILHGYFGAGDNWKTLANKFSETYEVHTIDQRNHGRSFHSDTFNYDVLVADLKKYMEFHSLDKAILLGHSMGGKTVMQFAVNYPEMVEKLIVADIAPKYYPPHHEEILKALNSVDFTVHHSRKLVDEQLSRVISEVGIRMFLMKNLYWKEKGELAFRFNLESLTENNNEVGEALPSFSTYTGKTLFLKGENSGYISSNEKPLIDAHFTESEIKEVKNAGHWLHAENPKDFYDIVTVFLTK